MCLVRLLLSRCQLLADLRDLLLQGCALLQLDLQLGLQQLLSSCVCLLLQRGELQSWLPYLHISQRVRPCGMMSRNRS